MSWYTVPVLAGHENKVKMAIEIGRQEGRIPLGLRQVIIPLSFEKRTTEGGNNVVRKVKTYPGVLFIEMNRSEALDQALLGTSGIVNRNFAHVTADEIERELERLSPPEPEVPEKVTIAEGTSVRIKSGPFEDQIGTFVSASGSKVTINLNLFGKDTPAELQLGQIEILS